MTVRMSLEELQERLLRTQARIKKLENEIQEFLIYHDTDSNGELENMWTELEFLQAKEDALLTQISMRSSDPKQMDSLFARIHKEIKDAK